MYHVLTPKQRKFVALRGKIPPPPHVVCLVILQVKVLQPVYAHFIVLGLAIIKSDSAQLVWLPIDQWYRRYTIHKESIKFSTFTVISTLKIINRSEVQEVSSGQKIRYFEPSL